MRFHLVKVTGQQQRRCIIPQTVNTVCAPEDGRNYRPKHVELIGIINKPLFLHLFGCLYYCISEARPYKHRWACCELHVYTLLLLLLLLLLLWGKSSKSAVK